MGITSRSVVTGELKAPETVNSVAFSDTFTGWYHVNAHCKGAASNTFGSAGWDHVNYLLVERGNEIKLETRASC